MNKNGERAQDTSAPQSVEDVAAPSTQEAPPAGQDAAGRLETVDSSQPAAPQDAASHPPERTTLKDGEFSCFHCVIIIAYLPRLLPNM